MSTGGWAEKYFFDYNTVELVLLGCAIVVCASGIMFTTGQFDDARTDTLWQRDLIGTVVMLIVGMSLLYYFIVVISELCSDEKGCGCINKLVKCFGRTDRNAKIIANAENNIDDGDIEMNSNPLQTRNQVDSDELKRIRLEAQNHLNTNQQLMAALRGEKNKNAHNNVLHSHRTPKAKGREKRRKKEFSQKTAGDEKFSTEKGTEAEEGGSMLRSASSLRMTSTCHDSWEKHLDESENGSGKYFYYNPKSGVTQWNKPQGFTE